MKKSVFIFAKVLPIFMMCFAACSAWSGVYKCPDGQGKSQFQDRPCTGGQSINVKPSMGPSDASTVSTQSIGARKSNADPLVGMGKNHLIQLWGTPARQVGTTDHMGAKIERLTFSQHGQMVVVDLKNGVVFDTATVARDEGYSASRNTRTCPSDTDIRNAEVSASSITLSDDEKRQRRYEIDRMKACVAY